MYVPICAQPSHKANYVSRPTQQLSVSTARLHVRGALQPSSSHECECATQTIKIGYHHGHARSRVEAFCRCRFARVLCSRRAQHKKKQSNKNIINNTKVYAAFLNLSSCEHIMFTRNMQQERRCVSPETQPCPSCTSFACCFLRRSSPSSPQWQGRTSCQ